MFENEANEKKKKKQMKFHPPCGMSQGMQSIYCL